MTIKEGGDWLKIEGPNAGQCAIAAAREQKILLKVDTRGIPAGGTFGAKLTVITNGGVAEVMARMDLMAQPYPKPPFQGAKTPREMAERMRKLPKAAVPALESGEVSRWFASNGWNFPVRETQAKGVAAVQQFFETMGLSKPPAVHLSQTEIRLNCAYPETARTQISLQTPAKKWVYASVTTECPWLRVLTPLVGGPQQANIAFEIDPKLGTGATLEGKLKMVANGGKILMATVIASVSGLPRARRDRVSPVQSFPSLEDAAPSEVVSRAAPPSGGWLGSIMAMAFAFFLVRLLLIPLVDLGGRSQVIESAVAKLGVSPALDGPLSSLGGWLQLPWGRIMTGEGGLPTSWFNPAQTGELPTRELRHYFASYFLRRLIIWTWWLGAIGGGIILVRKGGSLANLPWGIVAGAMAGLAGSVTLGSVFLVLEIVPQLLWGLMLPGQGGGLGFLILWVLLALFCWACCGAFLGAVLGLIHPLRRNVVGPVQKMVTGICRICGLRALA